MLLVVLSTSTFRFEQIIPISIFPLFYNEIIQDDQSLTVFTSTIQIDDDIVEFFEFVRIVSFPEMHSYIYYMYTIITLEDETTCFEAKTFDYDKS